MIQISGYWELVRRRPESEITRRIAFRKEIHLLGFQENPYPYIRKADVFVLTSDMEGFSLVVCEALCLGVPVISTAVTGPVELLSDQYGIITELSAEAVASSINTQWTILKHWQIIRNVQKKDHKYSKQIKLCPIYILYCNEYIGKNTHIRSIIHRHVHWVANWCKGSTRYSHLYYRLN